MCRVENGRYYSALSKKGDTVMIKEYEEGKWTERKKGEGPFGVFDTSEHAVDFIALLNRMNDIERMVLPCYYKQSKELSFWYEYNKHKQENVGIGEPPIGTIFADKVKI